MTAPLIVITAGVLCAVLSRIIYALNERTLQKAQNRTDRMAEKCDEMAQLIQEINDTNDALSDGLLKLSASFGVSCDDAMRNMNQSLKRLRGNLEVEECIHSASFATNDYVPAYSQANAPLAPQKCPNCGAPVRGRECEYCGTVFS